MFFRSESASNVLENRCSMEAENEYEKEQVDNLEKTLTVMVKQLHKYFQSVTNLYFKFYTVKFSLCMERFCYTYPCTTISSLLPSSIEKSGFSVHVSDKSTELEITAKWPTLMTDPKLMHKKWFTSTTPRHEEYHPESTGFAEAIKEHRFRSSDWIESQWEIDLLFTVQTVNTGKYHLACHDDSTHMVYASLKAADENYSIEEDKEGFEIF